MISVENLRVSLTKNGYLKGSELVQLHPANEILDNVRGVHRGINLVKSQVANILGADASGNVPSYWDVIRKYKPETVDAFFFVAIIFSHHRLIEVIKEGKQGQRVGYLSRDQFSTEKEYTNLAFAMAKLQLSGYVKGAKGVVFDLSPLTVRLKSAAALVRRLLRDKLARCGWQDPEEHPDSTDLPFIQQCQELGWYEVFGLSFEEFSAWIAPRRA